MKKTTKTISAKDVNQQWWLFDASNQVLGRFASEVAQVLRGKHRPDYSPNIYMGDAVIIVNADKIRVTGNKSETKRYFRHSFYPGAVKYARERGGMVIAPIASDNKRAVSAMLGAYGFRLDRIIPRWYDPKDLAIYIEDTGTKPYQNV